ncbi:MAG: hypothetical protein H2172_17095 [Opitutus sp.]|nr:hypothetical protein [Opitutus sp.]MCS6246489.1 hypothetical protein [Opitutus sp.]MCS6274625.1 hypothetical protein [Opitutus sp.]MCS6278784.1 hypothetical protein [Opitutus sp.]MCS6299638.1 hypothetical protein [Opitutus sp.]
MSVASQLKSLLAHYRPDSAHSAELTRLAKLASPWLDQLAQTLGEIDSDVFDLNEIQLSELALAMTEMADDLHADSGLWWSLESCNTTLFGTPLPGLFRPADSSLIRFDARRFQFFLEGVWRHFQPDAIVSPRHLGFLRISQAAETFFTSRLSDRVGSSSVASLLDSSHERGWELKQKLVWLGTRSFLLRFDYEAYVHRETGKRNDSPDIAITDDFLAQECTGWSGLGALELLAERLAFQGAERADLLSWQARHAAFYRVDAVAVKGGVLMTMDLLNLIGERPYHVRIEVPRANAPFQVGEMVFGSLVPWRGEWYWSGTQKRWPQVPADFAPIRSGFFQTNAQIAYRYCPERAAKARQFGGEQHADFVRFHGTDLVVFPDGLAVAAAEQRRMRQYNKTRAAALGLKRGETAASPRCDENGPRMPIPKEVLDCRQGIAVFSQPEEGVEIMREFDVLRAALRSEKTPLTEEQAEVLQGFIESGSISPAFVRRVIGANGDSGLTSLFYVPAGDGIALDHLLRRHKGAYYRPRQPHIALVDE